VTIETSSSGGLRPIISGKTNLPDGMSLSLTLHKPRLSNAKELLAAGTYVCNRFLFADGTCAPLGVGRAYAVVKNGQFTYGPFTNDGAPLPPGTYILEVTSHFVARAAPEVLAVIGPLGENMRGPLVGGCCFASLQDENYIQNVKKKNLIAAPTLGYSVYYGRYLEVRPD